MIAAAPACLATYFRAFDAGDTRTYASFYATDVELQNGAGERLAGAQAIIAFYEKLRCGLTRSTHVRLVVPGRCSIAALLESRFDITAESLVFSGDKVGAGDRIELRSMALYELSGAKFQRITARTIEKTIIRRGRTA
ncbi:MAG: nuclear transport factor 2 family protein [Sphingobium sp.]|nr:nuclear transport factor 2 family protein [Sphingobium sp.]